MTPSGTPKIHGPKRGATPLEGAERCPECGVLQDWKDLFMTVGVGEDLVRMWVCHSCGHLFRSWGDGILETDEWPVRQRDGSYKVRGVEWVNVS